MGRRDLFRIEMKVEVEFKDFNQFYQEYTKNISKGGIFIKTPNILKPQTVVEIFLKLPDLPTPLAIVGEVVHVLDPETAKANGWDPGMGIHFVDFKESAQQNLEAYIARKYTVEPAARGSDRRRDARVAVRLRVKFPSLDVLQHDYSDDISRGGIFIQTQKPRKIGERFLLTLVHPETSEELEIPAEVVRITGEDPKDPSSVTGMGIKFMDMDENLHQRIETFLGLEFPLSTEF
jgi:type IV pilus assembly protein PilZ